MIRVYLAGAMRNKKNLNFPVFAKYAKQLRAEGHTVFNPASKKIEEHAGTEMENLKFRRKVFQMDTDWICRKAECVALIPGWEESKGATAEKCLAEAIGLTIRFL